VISVGEASLIRRFFEVDNKIAVGQRPHDFGVFLHKEFQQKETHGMRGGGERAPASCSICTQS
jgi:hypothetical protein